MREEWQEFLTWELTTHLGLWVGALIMMILLSVMLRQKRNPSASAAWLVFMLAVPYIGVPLYLAIGARKLRALVRQKRRLFEDRITHAPAEQPIQRLLSRLGVPDPAAATSFRLHASASQARAALWRIVDQARTSVDIEIFILADDETGRQLLDRLTILARAGVRVRLLLDGVGSFLLPRIRLRPLLEAGVQVAWFVPVLHVPLRGRSNLRNHRKLVVVDGRKVWSGGRNLADDYLGDEDRTHWHDLSFDLEGAVAADYQGVFEADWSFASGKAAAPAEELLDEVGSEAPEHRVQVIPSGPDMSEDVVEHALAGLVRGAQRRVVLVTPYYVPSESLQQLLCVTVRSGVEVDLLLPERSNHRMADYVRNRFLRELHKAGVRIWTLPRDMLHAKATIVDDRYALVGSANVDLRSLYLNFELMTLLYTDEDVSAVQQLADTYLDRSEAWRPPARSALRETFEGLAMLLAFQL